MSTAACVAWNDDALKPFTYFLSLRRRILDDFGEVEVEGLESIEMEVVESSGMSEKGMKGRMGRAIDKVKGKTKRKKGKKYGRLGDEDESEDKDEYEEGRKVENRTQGIDEDDLDDI